MQNERKKTIFKLYPGATQISFLIFQIHFCIVEWKVVVILRSNCKRRKKVRGSQVLATLHIQHPVMFSDKLTCLSRFAFPNTGSNTKGVYLLKSS